MSTSQNATVKPQRRFQFIDNSNVSTSGNNSTQVRRHVMQEYMREKRWEARSQAETALFEQEPRRHAYRLPQGDSRRRNSRHGKKDDSKLTRTTPTTPMIKVSQSASKTVSVRPKKDNSHNLKNRTRATTADNMSNPNKYHPSFWRRAEVSTKLATRGFFLDAGSFAQLADMIPAPGPKTFKSVQYAVSKRLSPVTQLSAARTDPFDALPMNLNTEDQELFDFYATVMPSCSSGFEKCPPQAQRWYHNVLIPEAMKGAVTFQNTVLQHAAVTQTLVMGSDETELALRHGTRAAEMLDHHCRQFPEDVSDEIISATVSAAALADLHPCLVLRRSAWSHWAAALHKIQQSGGPVALEQKSSLCKLINWQDYVLSGYDCRGSSFYATPEPAYSSKGETKLNASGRGEIVAQCEEFLVFLRCIDQLASVVASQSENPRARQYQPLRYTSFARNQPLYKLLGQESKPPKRSAKASRRKICRLASLITISVAVWEHRYDSTQSEAFFEELIQHITDNQLDRDESTELLLQILLYNSDSPASGRSERPWLVGRLLKVSKRLSRSSWEWVNDFLWSNLALDGRRSGQLGCWEKRLRKEILEAPLYKHDLVMLDF